MRPDGPREGRVIWHTTGSGKSLTMVFLCKALLLHRSLTECRVVACERSPGSDHSERIGARNGEQVQRVIDGETYTRVT